MSEKIADKIRNIRDLLLNIKHTKESLEYKKKYFDDIQEQYEERRLTASNGETATFIVPKQRKSKQHEIDEVFFLRNLGINVKFCQNPNLKPFEINLLNKLI